MDQSLAPDFRKRFEPHFRKLFGDDVERCLKRLKMLIGRYGLADLANHKDEYNWTHEDAILITYADMIYYKDQKKLNSLTIFLKEYIQNAISTVHLLPFFPYSSDEGFSVIDYRKVREDLGDWNTVQTLTVNYRLMADLVINHTSSESEWFQDFVYGIAPGRDYFITVDPDADLTEVVRPRSSPLLQKVQTRYGDEYVWNTFSEDQIDLDFSNPDVLFEFLDILMFYISKGVEVIRLDAIAYLWKKTGTSCIHLPETHEVVKLIRELVDLIAPGVTIITETNVPHEENISYFGNGDEAHMVYQFSLPPLLLHAILFEDATYLTEWASTLGSLPEGCTYFNFTASHDGIGVRPLEGLIPGEQMEELAGSIKEKGGFVSYKANSDGSESPYELNITYLDAFKEPGSANPEDPLEAEVSEKQYRQFMCSQIVMLSLKGVPGIYFHNLTGTQNDLYGVQQSGEKRAINRYRWHFKDLIDRIENPETSQHTIFKRYKQILELRAEHSAFHPFGSQNIFNLHEKCFALHRRAPENQESVFVVANVSGQAVSIDLEQHHTPIEPKGTYLELLSNEELKLKGGLELNPWQVIWLKLF